jgi:hypothetical protein
MLTKTGQEMPHAQKSYAKLKRELGTLLDSNKSVNGLKGAQRKTKNETNFSKAVQEEYIKSVEEAKKAYYDNLVKTKGKEAADEFLKLVDSEDTDALFNVLEYDRDYSASASRWWDNIQGHTKGAKKSTYALTGMTEDSINKVGDILSRHNIDYTITKNGELIINQSDVKELKNIPSLKNEFKRIDDTFTINDKEDINEIRKLLDDNGISYKKVKGKNEITITDDINKLKNNKKLKPYADRLGLKRTTLYTDEQLETLEGTLNTYKTKFGDFYEARKKDFQNLAEINKNQTGVDLTDITAREGYGRRAYTAQGKQLFENQKKATQGGGGLLSDKTLGTRKYGSALEAQNAHIEAHAKRIEKLNKQIENLQNASQEYKIKGLRKQKRAVTKQLKIKQAQLDENLRKLGIKKEKYQQMVNEITQSRQEIVPLLKKTLSKKVANVYTSEGMERVSTAGTRYINAIEKTDRYTAMLTDPELTKDMTPAKIKQIKGRLESAKLAEERAKKSYVIQYTRAQNFLDKETSTILKTSERAIKKGRKSTEQIIDTERKLNKTLNKIDELTSVKGDTVSRLNETIDKLSKKIESAKNLPASYEKQRLEKIANLQKSLSVLETEEATQIFDYAYRANLEAFVNMSTEYSKGVKLVNEALMTGTLEDPSFITLVDDVKDIGELPNNFIKVDGDSLAKTLSLSKGALPENSEQLANLAKKYSGKQVFVDKDLAHLLNIVSRTNNDTNAFVKVLDKINSSFKKFSVMSPGFQIRNIIGNATNMYLAGMPPHQIMAYWGKANDILKNSNNIIKKVLLITILLL